MPPTTTATWQLIEDRLGRSLRDYVTEQQAAGIGWRRIAANLCDDTSIRVSHETLRGWFAEDAA